uniref:Uncharacterized protein n=1 Tax=Bactrocera latifrons TaxID=174628 RepID=A0A0K8V8L8_BACLA
MDNPHCNETNSNVKPPIMDGLKCVSMLPEQFMNWCLTGLERANESLRMLVSINSVKTLSKDMATITEPQLLSAEPATKIAANKKSYTNNAKRKPQSTEKKMICNVNEMFPYQLDRLRRVLYADDEHMLRQELAEEHYNTNFFNQLENAELNHNTLNAKMAQEALVQKLLHKHHAMPAPTETESTHKVLQSRERRLCRLLGGGVNDRKCRCNCCGKVCQPKRSNRTFVEYDWTNYDWCKPLRAELQRRTKHLNRLKRELQLRAIRVLPNVTHF